MKGDLRGWEAIQGWFFQEKLNELMGFWGRWEVANAWEEIYWAFMKGERKENVGRFWWTQVICIEYSTIEKSTHLQQRQECPPTCPPLQLIKLKCERYINVTINPFARGPLFCFFVLSARLVPFICKNYYFSMIVRRNIDMSDA